METKYLTFQQIYDNDDNIRNDYINDCNTFESIILTLFFVLLEK